MAGLASMHALLSDTGRIDAGYVLRLVPGGVSSTVVAVEGPTGAWVAKRPRRRLAVADEWYADPARGLREAAVLRFLGGRVGPVRTPRLRFVDAESLVIGMEMIPPPAPAWKDLLLAGRVDPGVGRLIARAATALHAVDGRSVPGLGGPGATRLYEELRIDPYYRTAARRLPALAAPLHRLIADTTGAGVRRALVHGDLNPKNVLVTPSGPVLLDWELAHIGDPAFDLAMPVAHLILKSLRRDARPDSRTALLSAARAFWCEYSGPADRDLAVRHVGGILAARLWGKSPVDYLSRVDDRSAVEAVAGVALTGDSNLEAVLSEAEAVA